MNHGALPPLRGSRVQTVRPNTANRPHKCGCPHSRITSRDTHRRVSFNSWKWTRKEIRVSGGGGSKARAMPPNPWKNVQPLSNCCSEIRAAIQILQNSISAGTPLEAYVAPQTPKLTGEGIYPLSTPSMLSTEMAPKPNFWICPWSGPFRFISNS